MKFSAETFATLIERALAEIPDQLVPYLEDVIIDVQPTPDARTCAEAGVDDPTELLGFYRGTPLTERSVEQSMMLPDSITIYQDNIERMCRTKNQIVRQIRLTVLHELGHHFGLDEDDLEELGYE